MQFDRTIPKLNDTATQVAFEVQESCDACSLRPSQIINGEFSCQEENNEHEVTYRARLRGNTDSDCNDIIDDIAVWLEGSPASITVQGNRLSLASNCEVEVDDFKSALECEQPTTMPTVGVTTLGLGSTEAISVPIIAGAAAGGAVLVIVILVVIIVVISVVASSRKKRKRCVCVHVCS